MGGDPAPMVAWAKKEEKGVPGDGTAAMKARRHGTKKVLYRVLTCTRGRSKR